MFIEGHLSYGSWATTVGTGSVVERFSVPHVICPELLVLGAELRVLVALMLGLRENS